MYRIHKAVKNAAKGSHISGSPGCAVLISFFLATLALPAHAQWTQAWSDEFNGPAGSFPDPTKWTYDVHRMSSWTATAIWSSAR